MKIPLWLYSFYEKYMTLIGIAGHLLFFFQAYKIATSHSAADVSLTGFFIALFSLANWLIYGLVIGNKTLIRTNCFGVLGASLCVIAIILFSN